jgi:signal transduction histidine kinase
VTGRRASLRDDQWFSLLLMTRLLGTAAAVLLLIVHRVTDHDGALTAVTLLWSGFTLAAFGHSTALRASPVAWALDAAGALALVVASGDWRSPFYVYALTTLVLPATTLSWRRAIAWGVGFSAAYAFAAWLTRQLPADTIENTIRLETIATHLLVPVMITLALAYAGELLERLRRERERAEQLSLQAERQRIAWELHDSAKQRVHAAHLLLSALDGRLVDGQRTVVDHAVAELRGATADMETSIAELRAPVDGRPVDELLRERAAALERAGGARIIVTGRLPFLEPVVAAQLYRIAGEALTNAVRHAGASRVDVTLGREGGEARVDVADDGAGLPEGAERRGHGLRSMRGRAQTIDAALQIGPGPGGRGTRVAVTVPAAVSSTALPGGRA